MDRKQKKRRARLADLRNRITDGLTLEEAAREIREGARVDIDLTGSYLSKIISGAKIPARHVADEIVRYARNRGVTLADLGIEVK